MVKTNKDNNHKQGELKKKRIEVDAVDIQI